MNDFVCDHLEMLFHKELKQRRKQELKRIKNYEYKRTRKIRPKS